MSKVVEISGRDIRPLREDEVEFRSREDVELENVNGGRTCSLVMYNCAGKPVARYH